MKLESLLFKLSEAARVSEDDMELGHMMADAALLEYVNNPKITDAYDEVVKNYERRIDTDTSGDQREHAEDCNVPRQLGQEGTPHVDRRAETGGQLNADQHND